MNHIKRALVVVVATLGRSWGLVRTALTSGRRRAAASLIQVNTIRRRYALGAASREEFDATVRKLGPSARRARRASGKGRRKTAA